MWKVSGVEEVKKAACWFCYQHCGLLVKVKDNTVISVQGDPEHPVNQGGRCPRNFAWKEFHDHPGRLNYPLKRSGAKGDGRWERISWNQTLDEIAGKLKEIKEKFGAEAVASVGGTYRTDDWARRRFFNLFGSPNITHIAPVCGMNTYAIECAIFGWGSTPDIPNSKTIVMWGHNAGVTYFPVMRGILDAKENNDAKLIVIDPRFTESASKADVWLQLRPGTDGALALSWLNIIINEALYDREFVDRWCYGFDELKEYMQKFSPKWAEEVTWIPSTKIEEAARLYATNKPSCILWGAAVDHIGWNAWAAVQARAILKAVTGNLDVPGGNVIAGPHPLLVTDEELELNDKLPPDQRKKQVGSQKYKMMSWPGYELLREQNKKFWGKCLPAEWFCEAHAPSLWRAIITGNPYPVRALIILASNPLISYANTNIIHKALTGENLELLVVMDYWMTPTATLADYVLPAAGWMERPVLSAYFGMANWFVASERPIRPLHERKTDYWFWKELGRRLEQKEYWAWEDIDEANSYRVQAFGYGSYEQFVRLIRMDFAPKDYRSYEQKGFGTPTGKVELSSTVLEKLGYKPLPEYEEPAESPIRTPEVYKEYPLVLISGSFLPYHHSEHRQISLLRKMAPEPLVEIHPETAMGLGIAEGDWVYVENRRGKVKMKAVFNIGLHPRVVFAQKGWWFPEESTLSLYGFRKSNINLCTGDDEDFCDPLCGSWNYKALLCRVYPALDEKVGD